MSFFSDCFESISLSDFKDKVVSNIVFGECVKIVGNLKIEIMQEDMIVLFSKKEKFQIDGNDMKILSIAKGEYEIGGNIIGVKKI